MARPESVGTNRELVGQGDQHHHHRDGTQTGSALNHGHIERGHVEWNLDHLLAFEGCLHGTDNGTKENKNGMFI